MTAYAHQKVNPETFKTNYEGGRTQLYWTWMSADLITPCAAYLKLCGHNPYSFLFESVEGGSVLGRYSIIGLEPDLIWSCVQEDVDLQIWHDYSGWESVNDKPLSALRTLIAKSKIDDLPESLPPMVESGLFGFLSYDMIRQIEKIPDNNADDLEIPDSIMMRPTVLVIFDNVQNSLCIVTPVYKHKDNDSADADKVLEDSRTRVDSIRKRLETQSFPVDLTTKSALNTPLNVESNTTEAEFKDMVKRAVEYTKAGDIFQCVPSQRFSVDFDLHSFDLYRSLRRLNPSPFLFHVAFENFSLVGSSPEILVRVRDETVTIRPIAGTRKRGKTPAEDRDLAEDLLSDPKERAEHLMLLDLGRNDVGRVSEIGSVNVTDQFKVELYSHVMHIVSNVEGKLRADVDSLDAFFAGFPAGTVSGAPKIRAMEIIDELEKSKRSFYAGGVGYFSGNGTVDTCIALRTALVKDGKVYVQAGAGVVADSDPDSEYQETQNKAQALLKAAELAIEQSKY